MHSVGISRGPVGPDHALDENGQPVPAAEHDILTGSEADGTAAGTFTCNDWTSSGNFPKGKVGHSDVPPPQFNPSWNAAHLSNGCSETRLALTAGSGRTYCFAADPPPAVPVPRLALAVAGASLLLVGRLLLPARRRGGAAIP